MPLVANSDLPTFERLRQEGETIIPKEVAIRQDIRGMHIGLLNMMPDAALAATERQFFRLIGESNQIAQFYLHPFTLPEINRSQETTEYIKKYYQPFEQLQEEGLDALIITGANVTQPQLSFEPFWEPLIKIINWAYDNVTSTLCSCLATHAVLEFRYHQPRQRLPAKRWGVFSHQVVDRNHPLVRGANTRFDVPHSRFNDISMDQFKKAGIHILAESGEGGIHLAVSEDLFRIVFFQGHPEYDSISLLKEYKREVLRFAHKQREDYPPFPKNYFCLKSQAILEEYKDQIIMARDNSALIPDFPESLVVTPLDNTWHDTAETVLNNWIGNVYQVTHHDRCIPFKEGVNPYDPLGLRYQNATIS
ncbi:homoserine O-succinyltransferase MetA [Candidatus Nitrosacidococcus tergens]|uniref:Homoserine O-succinyltransferase n=1 Tax=Candidatus Nitrosacidococcus tergens TaxID=553981 RepID=A0A7G1Q8Y4_9GAMM|nr:homoserine O-succinyltransferase [Candidatus Nitrosacidococcus tergens]CAB1275343.1 Homoserine O-succinyltransferase [Candidatus Nitrosacidococcus tergens]